MGRDYFAAVLTIDGDVVWKRTYDYADDSAAAIVQSNDGGFVLVGSTDTASTDGIKGWVVKTDWTGAKQWERLYGDAERDDWVSGIVKIRQRGRTTVYVIVGTTLGFAAEQADYWLFQIDMDGNPQRSTSFDSGGSDAAEEVVKTPDGYALIGTIRTEGESDSGEVSDYWLVKTDQQLRKQWSETTIVANKTGRRINARDRQ